MAGIELQAADVSSRMGTKQDLNRWVDAGLIGDDAAAAILEFEEQRAGPSGIGRGTEAVAYLGSVLVLVALGILAVEFWTQIDPGWRVALSAAVAVVLIGVGLILGRSDAPPARRALAFAWFLAVAAIALTSSVVFGDLLSVEAKDNFLIAALISTTAAVVLWLRNRSPLQLIAVWIAANASLVAAISRAPDLDDQAFGIGFSILGVVWLALTWLGVLGPTRTSYAVSAVNILFIAFPEGTAMPWPVVGLVAGLALMAASVAIDENVLLGLGVAGLFIYIPLTIFELFGDSLGVPVALLLTGIVLLGVVVATVRLRASP